MSQPSAKNSKPVLQAQLRLMLGDEIAFGPGKADLLDAIRETGSISAAGKKLAMSYRRTWLLVDTMNRCFHKPLVNASKGGANGGGTQLTEYGTEVLQHYRELQREVAMISEKYFANFKPLLRKKPIVAQ